MCFGNSKIINITEQYIMDVIRELSPQEKMTQLLLMLVNQHDYDKPSRKVINNFTKNYVSANIATTFSTRDDDQPGSTSASASSGTSSDTGGNTSNSSTSSGSSNRIQ